ncbi:MAG TPA: hypothetical protein VMR74_01890 [Gammaproteobacteria bacterium]|nr:hypothetical protein [Gammaproteobacteria bacterium]
MTELDRTWAETQIEAMADGSLSAGARRRMLAAMDRDPALAARVEQARALSRALRGLAAVPVPRGLWWRLWRIPTADRPRRNGIEGMWVPTAGIFATAVVAALGINVFLGTRGPTAEEEAQAAAVRDFTVAMAYLQKSVLMANNEINVAVGSGVLDVLAMSGGMLERTEIDGSNGEQDND